MNAAILLAATVTWVAPDCTVFLDKTGDKYLYALTDGSRDLTCSIDKWENIDCGDGKPHTVRMVDKQTVEVDGIVMKPKGHKDVLCD